MGFNLILGFGITMALIAIPIILLLMWDKEEPPKRDSNE